MNTIHNPAAGTVAPAAWGDQIDANFDFLSAPPTCRVKLAAAQSVASGTSTVINFDQEQWDTDTIHDTVTNNSRLTAKTAGQYAIFAYGFFSGGTESRRAISIRKNASSIIVESDLSKGIGADQVVYFEEIMAVNDYVEILVLQDSGAALTWNGQFGMTWVRT